MADLTPDQRARIDDPVGAAIMALYLDLCREAALVYVAEFAAYVEASRVAEKPALVSPRFLETADAERACVVVQLALSEYLRNARTIDIEPNGDDPPRVAAARVRLRDVVTAARAAVEKGSAFHGACDDWRRDDAHRGVGAPVGREPQEGAAADADPAGSLRDVRDAASDGDALSSVRGPKEREPQICDRCAVGEHDRCRRTWRWLNRREQTFHAMRCPCAHVVRDTEPAPMPTHPEPPDLLAGGEEGPCAR